MWPPWWLSSLSHPCIEFSDPVECIFSRQYSGWVVSSPHRRFGQPVVVCSIGWVISSPHRRFAQPVVTRSIWPRKRFSKDWLMYTQSVLVVLIILTIDVYCSTMDSFTNKNCAGEIDHTITQSLLVSNDHFFST